MKRIFIIMAGLLLIGTSAFAQGDLIVNGKLGVGTSSPLNKLHVDSLNEAKVLRLDSQLTAAPVLTNIGAYYSVVAAETGISGFRYIGFQGEVNLTGYGSIGDLIGAENKVTLNASGSGSTINSAKGNTVILVRGTLNNKPQTLVSYYGFHSYGAATGSGNINGSDWRHAYFENFPNYGGTVSEVSGLWIDKQTLGTDNHGVVLNGDGAGADIVLGAAQDTSIYASGGEIFVKDGASNVTQISPHDPETGEWIYYSRNKKTGVVKRVNMEKLVKAVEKLTGEQFLFESLEEVK